MKITYDKFGRMNYHPKYHTRHGLPWDDEEELEYLINYFDITGSEEMSFALERTEASIIQKVAALRKQNIMSIAINKKYQKRMKKERGGKN